MSLRPNTQVPFGSPIPSSIFASVRIVRLTCRFSFSRSNRTAERRRGNRHRSETKMGDDANVLCFVFCILFQKGAGAGGSFRQENSAAQPRKTCSVCLLFSCFTLFIFSGYRQLTAAQPAIPGPFVCFVVAIRLFVFRTQFVIVINIYGRNFRLFESAAARRSWCDVFVDGPPIGNASIC